MSTREELIRQAETCLRQGRVDEAIAHYQELVHLEPVDWALVKQLADLLERAGQREGAARQFARWADHLFTEGFHSKASALYKKVLKLDAADEHALWQLGEVSIALKLMADARVAFQRVVDLRQRRGDAAGAAMARQRRDALESVPTGPPQPPAMPPAYASAGHPPSRAPVDALPAAPAMRSLAPLSLSSAVDPVLTPLPEASASGQPSRETADQRLAQLRREAEVADARHAPDAEARWHAVLAENPGDVAVRLRLVQAAIETGDLETASGLALALDASEDPALVALVDLAYRQGRPEAVDRLIAGRVHAGAAAEHVLAPVDLLAARHPGAARAALGSAVGAWLAASQPGHAVAALERAEPLGVMTTALHLQWVEICVDAGLPGLSRAQRALARAYLADGLLAEARAVAEDLFVREAGAEPSRALLLEILDHQGVATPHRVLVDLLTPPSDSIGDDLPDASAIGDVDEMLMASSDAAAAAVAAGRAGVPAVPGFDWADLLGRQVEAALAAASTAEALEPAVPLAPAVQVPSTPVPATVSDSPPSEADVPTSTDGLAPAPPAAIAPAVPDAHPDEPAGLVRPEPQADPIEVSPSTEAEAPPLRAVRSHGIGDLRAQPFLADDAPLQPSFSMPRAWLEETPEPLPPDAPRRRAPEDDFFFNDDATPPRWAPPPSRASTSGVSLPPPQAGLVDGTEAEVPSAAAAPAVPAEPVDAPMFSEAPVQTSEPAEVGGEDPVQVDEEVDLTQLLEELKEWDPELPEPLRKPTVDAPAAALDPAPPVIVPPAADEVLDTAFADLQRQGDDRSVAEQQLAAGRVFQAAGLASEAARAFERASAEPRTRFEAGLALAELHRSRGQLVEAVAWYEQAATAPVPDAAVKRAVLYDLAESLEALGETDRALGVLLDLLSQVEDYRDARARLDRLLRVDAGG